MRIITITIALIIFALSAASAQAAPPMPEPYAPHNAKTLRQMAKHFNVKLSKQQFASLLKTNFHTAHNAGGLVWDARGTSSTVSCDMANLIIAWWWHSRPQEMGAIGGYPTIQKCTYRINTSAVGGYSVAFCAPSYYCQASGIHDWVLDRDSSHAGFPGAVYIITTRHR